MKNLKGEKVGNMQKKQTVKLRKVSPAAHLKALNTFRAISCLEGLETTAEQKCLLEKLAKGKISKQEYIACKTCRKAA